MRGKRLKKIVAAALTAALIVPLLTGIMILKADAYVKGTYVNVRLEKQSSCQILVTGSGTCTYVKPLYDVKTLIVPDTVEGLDVTAIADEAFMNMSVKSVVIGNKVKVIGERAFYGCTNLKEVDITDKNLKTIGKEAFRGCEKLAEVEMSADKLKTIGARAFKGTKKKMSVYIHASNTNKYNKAVKKLRNAGVKQGAYRRASKLS